MSALQRLMMFLGFADGEGEDAGDGRRPGTVVDLASRTPQEIVVLHPRTFDDARAAADYLKMRRPVVVNLRGTSGDLARRIVDFTSGVTYALDGHLHRVAEEIFLFAPSHVVITADPGVDDVRSAFPLE
ncbi:MAG: cell division protein SepF [Armatimonadota bacterium]|nr:cell division protein SepF [Armatimonadota bacterium]MDR7402608.1 cell division protein SepF [Armatimonadota bacterium]MDR7404546.1 cell division protein SepF [Armatimonadota bacterium]MDR7436790.1 cell division protein SepF [Armatimonadota bacterium]MDR7472737.1 cell division protein SepF [Armatimonadota bacterium]